AVDEAGDRPAVISYRGSVRAVLFRRGRRDVCLCDLQLGRRRVVEAVVVGRTAGAGDRPRRVRDRRGRAVVRGAAGGRVAGGRGQSGRAVGGDGAGDGAAVSADRDSVGAVRGGPGALQ